MSSEVAENLRAVYLTAEDMNVANSILYQAYHDDPFFLDCFDVHSSGYEQRLRAAIREELAIFWEKKQPMIGVFDDANLLVGVACLIDPQSDFGAERFWHWRLKMMLTTGYVSTKNMIEKEEAVRTAIPHQNYHLMAFIAVQPNHQHLGIGHYLLNAIDTLIDEQGSTKGVGVLVTVDKYQHFFESADYEKISDVRIGRVRAKLMFKNKL